MSTFKVGQKVVCVDDAYCPEIPIGAIYTVLAIDTCCQTWLGLMPDDGTNEPCYQCGRHSNGPYSFFVASSFRPLIEDLTASLARTESERWVEEKQEHVNEPQHA